MSEPEDEVRFLDLDDLLDVIRFATGGPPVVRDSGLLESALHRPMSTVFGEDAYPSLFAKAAALLESLVRNYALVDGNKRTAWLACWFFLRLNGFRLASSDGQLELILGIAEGRIELADSAAALEGWSAPT